MNNLIPLIDSRKLINPEQSIFYAIAGSQNNGHKYVPELYRKGVRHFVIEDKNLDVSNMPDATFRHVSSSIRELQHAAKTYREQFNIPVIGITGSNGKTIVKEWLSEMLSPHFVIAKSPRSYNSQVGVPLSVFGLRSYHTLGIFEAGISTTNEMQHLQPVVKPSIGILTNIGTAHDQGFASTDEKIAEKLKLFAHSEVLIYRNENPKVNQQINRMQGRHISWGMNDNADVNMSLSGNTLSVSASGLGYTAQTYQLPLTDKASVENMAHCIVTMMYLSITSEDIQKALHRLKPISMRMEMKNGRNNCKIIDDSYNNDLAGLQTALELFDLNNPTLQRTVILSDLLQAGLKEEALYAQVNDMLVARRVKRLIGIGKSIGQYRNNFSMPHTMYDTAEEMLSADETFENEVILLKGARPFAFEKIARSLVEKQHRATLEIHLGALTRNLNFYRSRLNENTKIMVMVKAFAYGTDGDAVANLLQFSRIDYLAVAYADEGVELRQSGITLPIMVMNPTSNDFANLVTYNLEPEIYSLSLLTDWLRFTADHPAERKVSMHLKLETGMHRLGVEQHELSEALQLLKQHNAPVASVFSHLAQADTEEGRPFTEQQIADFDSLTREVEKHISPAPLKHLLNSSGIINYPDAQYDMVRLGIGLYGFDPTYRKQLATVVRLTARVSQIKKVSKGGHVGYGNKGIVGLDTTIATINIGYADGFSRQFSNGKGHVHINGQRAAIVGNVCMDMIMVDVTDLSCREGDEVEIFGENITIHELAEKLSTIPYEILTSVSQRVKRVYFHES